MILHDYHLDLLPFNLYQRDCLVSSGLLPFDTELASGTVGDIVNVLCKDLDVFIINLEDSRFAECNPDYKEERLNDKIVVLSNFDTYIELSSLRPVYIDSEVSGAKEDLLTPAWARSMKVVRKLVKSRTVGSINHNYVNLDTGEVIAASESTGNDYRLKAPTAINQFQNIYHEKMTEIGSHSMDYRFQVTEIGYIREVSRERRDGEMMIYIRNGKRNMTIYRAIYNEHIDGRIDRIIPLVTASTIAPIKYYLYDDNSMKAKAGDKTESIIKIEEK